MTARRSRPFAVVLLSALLSTMAVACGSDAGEGVGTRVVPLSGPMPELAGEQVGGGAFDATGLAGQVVVINFWATWCAPCRREQPMLSDVEEAMRGQGVRFVGVNYRDDAAAAAAYLREFDVAYPSISDPAGDLAFAFEVPFLPVTIVVGPDGTLRARVVGEVDRATLEEMIASAVDETAPAPGASA